MSSILINFGRDLKNVGAYAWQAELEETYRTNGAEEFAVRFGQYALEKGYLTIDEVPRLLRSAPESDPEPLNRQIQRFVARKMGVPDLTVPAS